MGFVSSKVAPGGDPSFASVTLLLHCNGTNGSTTFTDSSSAANTLTANGNAQITTTNPKFGTGAYLGDGTTDYLIQSSSLTGYTLGSGDWTIEFFANIASGNAIFLDMRPVSTEGLYPSIYVETSNPKFLINGANAIAGAATISTGTWYHYALCKSSGNTKLFIDGTQMGSTYADSNTYLCSQLVLGVSAYNLSTYCLNGRIDGLRITKGVARYPNDFTAPSAEFPNS